MNDDDTVVRDRLFDLRDYFAGQALGVIPGDAEEPEELARDAYRIADAMLKERAKRKEREA